MTHDHARKIEERLTKLEAQMGMLQEWSLLTLAHDKSSIVDFTADNLRHEASVLDAMNVIETTMRYNVGWKENVSRTMKQVLSNLKELGRRY